jgi:hypothetical protein
MGPKFRRIELGVRERLPIHDDLARLNRFQPINAADERALAAAAGSAHHHDFASADFQVYAFEDVERAKPLVYIVKLDHGKKFNFQPSRFAKYRMAYYMNKGFLQQTQTHPLKNISPGQTAFCRAGKFSIKGDIPQEI